MTFVHPGFFHFLWLLPVLVALRLWVGWGRGRAEQSFVAARLRLLLVTGVSPALSWAIFLLQLLALSAFVGALAQPRWGVIKREIPETGKSVVIAIDTSRSMLADDVSPNRLTRAKLAAQDLVLTLRDERVGLVAFAGRGYVQAPLTTDHEAVIESIQLLDTNTIPRGGSSISDGIREAIQAFEKAKTRNHGLILFSDGAEDEPELSKVLNQAREKNVVILTVGVGTDAGSQIPDPDKPGDLIRDPATGMPVHTRLEDATLRRIAQETNGQYLKLSSQTLNTGVVADVLKSLDAMTTGNREESKPIERFYWPLSAGMLALMLALLLRPTCQMPRLSPAAAALVLGLLAQTGASAASNSDLNEARDAYRNHEYGHARDLYSRLLSEESSPQEKERLAYGLGAASQQLKDYDRAIDGFSRALESSDPADQKRAHQALGSSLYEQGLKSLQQQPEFTEKAWNDSLRHFEAADKLEQDAGIEENIRDLRGNLQVLKQQIEQQKKMDKQRKGDKKKDKGNGDKDKGQKGEDEEDGNPDSQKKGDQKGEKGDKQSKEDGSQDDKTAKKEDGDGKDGDQKKMKDGTGDEKDDPKKNGQMMADDKDQKDKGPEGTIQANEQGKPSKKELADAQQRELDEKQVEPTGYTRNEARNFLRTYNDQMAAKRPNYRERTVAKDW